MADISSLVQDIYKLAEGASAPLSSTQVSVDFAKWSKPRDKEREDKVLYFSEVGDPCVRRLWYKVNQKEVGEPVDGRSIVKFFYGDMLEELVLRAAQAAGHEVCDEQKTTIYDVGNGWKVRGRIDAIIDGVVVDVKSVTKFSEEKFKGGLKDDPFGYYSQLNGYASALSASSAGFLTIQKELGHIAFYPITVDSGHFQHQAEAATEVVSLSDPNTLPVIPPVPQSKTSKNMKLATSCSYCPYKKQCFPKMRTFLYSDGPVFLTHVEDTPRVMEVV